MEIKDLKPGDKIYYISNFMIYNYTYFSVHPKNSNYHIVISTFEEPKRIYKKQLQELLNLNLTTYELAVEYLITQLQNYIDDLKEQK